MATERPRRSTLVSRTVDACGSPAHALRRLASSATSAALDQVVSSSASSRRADHPSRGVRRHGQGGAIAPSRRVATAVGSGARHGRAERAGERSELGIDGGPLRGAATGRGRRRSRGDATSSRPQRRRRVGRVEARLLLGRLVEQGPAIVAVTGGSAPHDHPDVAHRHRAGACGTARRPTTGASSVFSSAPGASARSARRPRRRTRRTGTRSAADHAARGAASAASAPRGTRASTQRTGSIDGQEARGPQAWCVAGAVRPAASPPIGASVCSAAADRPPTSTGRRSPRGRTRGPARRCARHRRAPTRTAGRPRARGAASGREACVADVEVSGQHDRLDPGRAQGVGHVVDQRAEQRPPPPGAAAGQRAGAPGGAGPPGRR